jgi:hypothetical protein
MKNILFKNFALLLLIGMVVSCGRKSNNSNNPNQFGYQPPVQGPPNHNWNQYPSQGYAPPGNCGAYNQIPNHCYGVQAGYQYCGNMWYYQHSNQYWAFPSNGSCGANKPVNTGNNCNNNNSGGCSSGGGSSGGGSSGGSSSFNSGWKKLWSNMGHNQSKAITITVPKEKTYYLSFKGDYTGKKQSQEKLKVRITTGNWHTIVDLDQTHTGSSEITRGCIVPVNYKLVKGSYTITLQGNHDSVNDTHLRLTDYYPSDISRICN